MDELFSTEAQQTFFGIPILHTSNNQRVPSFGSFEVKSVERARRRPRLDIPAIGLARMLGFVSFPPANAIGPTMRAGKKPLHNYLHRVSITSIIQHRHHHHRHRA
jgi:hypothetical protein